MKWNYDNKTVFDTQLNATPILCKFSPASVVWTSLLGLTYKAYLKIWVPCKIKKHKLMIELDIAIDNAFLFKISNLKLIDFI